MAESEELYALAAAKGHTVARYDLPVNRALSVEDGRCYIGLDYSLRGAEEKERLAHELGHCEYGGFYNRYSEYDVRGKAERRADKWAYMKLAPLADVREAVASGIVEVWDLAERFDVSCKFMSGALAFYAEALGAGCI